jgi:outer membrane protein TolC
MQQASRLFPIRLLLLGWALALLTACKVLGPDYSPPQTPGFEDWNTPLTEDLITAQAELAQWWTIFADDDLSTLVAIAQASNNNTEIAALRVLESRAQLGIAIGNRYP